MNTYRSKKMTPAYATQTPHRRSLKTVKDDLINDSYGFCICPSCLHIVFDEFLIGVCPCCEYQFCPPCLIMRPER
jgi:hypothetical protein